VTLTGAGLGTGLRNGQVVRVEGALIDPESRQLRPAFRVRTIGPAGP
jgi:hypothetical protein